MRPSPATRRPGARCLPLAALFGLLLGTALAAHAADRIVVLDEDEERDTTRAGIEVSVSPDEEGGVRISLDGEFSGSIPGIDSVAAAIRRAERMHSDAVRRAHRYDAKRTSEIVSFGEDITVERDQIIEGDVVCFLGTIRIRGMVQGSAVALGGSVELEPDAIVHGDAVSLGGGEIRVSPGSVVSGEAVAIGGRIVERPGAHIGDRIELKFIPAVGGPPIFWGHGFGSLLLTLLLHIVFIGLIGLILVKLGARRWAASTATLKVRGWESLFAGLGAGILFAIVGVPLLLVIIFALIALVVGIPLVPLVALLLLVFPVPGYVVTAILLGGALRSVPVTDPRSPAQPGQGGSFLLGHLVLTVPWLLGTLLHGALGGLNWPAGVFIFLGWGVVGLAIAFGWGAFLLSRFGNRVPQSFLSSLAAHGLPPSAGGGAPVEPGAGTPPPQPYPPPTPRQVPPAGPGEGSPEGQKPDSGAGHHPEERPPGQDPPPSH